MFTLYTTEKKLVELYSTIGNPWQQVIFKSAIAVVSNTVPASESDNKNKNQILRLLHQQQKLRYDRNYIDSIPCNPEKVLTSGSSVFILDIPSIDAKKISDQYGVLCYSCSDPIENPLLTPGWTIDTGDSSIKQEWSSVISNTGVPSNYLILADRYLIASEKNKSDKTLNESIQDSYNNIFEILDSVLPKEFSSGVYQVSIICDATTINDKDKDDELLSFKDIAEQIWKIKKKLKRQYSFSIELISIDSNNCAYSETHDRKILSNYFIVSATHKLKAFRDGKSLTNQVLSFKYLFSEGLGPNSRSTIPETSHSQTAKNIKWALSNLSGSELYAYNGQVCKLEIKNRVFL